MMTSPSRQLLKVVLFVSVAAVGLTSCRSKPPELPPPNYMSIDELEARFHHAFYVPAPGLGARQGKSGLLTAMSPKETPASEYPKFPHAFRSRELGAIGYTWRGFSIGPWEGPKSNEWQTLEQLVPQQGAKVLQFPEGEALVAPPPTGRLAKSSLASAYRVFGDWLVEVTMGPPSKLAGKSDQIMPLMEEFVSNLVPYSEVSKNPSPSA